MFVMLLLPKVIQLKKEGQETQPILMKYVAYIAILSTIIVLVTFIFSRNGCSFDVWKSPFTNRFLLWKYAFVSDFAIANIFAYYFLSINEYIPVVVSALIGLTQKY
jgi:hypothetical protein